MTDDIDLYPALTGFHSEISPEQEIVLLCSRLEMAGAENRRLEELTRCPLRWERTMDLSDVYRTAPFLYRHLQGREGVPSGVISALRAASAGVLSANMLALRHLEAIDGIFRNAGIPYMLFKGAHLMLEVYGPDGFRVFTDIDVLIDEDGMAGLDSRLVENGFRRSGDRTRPGYRVHHMYEHDDMCLDVHTGIFGRRVRNEMLGIHVADMLERSRMIQYGGREYPVPGIVDTVLGLCLHISCQHGYIGLMWFADINEFIRLHTDDMDWEMLLERCREHRVRKAVYYALLFTKRIFSAPVPERVLRTLSEARGRMDDVVLKRIGKANSDMDYLAELFMFDSMKDAAGYIVGTIRGYPGMAGHFGRVMGEMVRQLLPGTGRAADTGRRR
jgi:hypothetical protein